MMHIVKLYVVQKRRAPGEDQVAVLAKGVALVTAILLD